MRPDNCSLASVLVLSLIVHSAAWAQATSTSVREQLLAQADSTTGRFLEPCRKQNPSMEDAMNGAADTYRNRMASILDELLATDKFKSLAKADMPKILVESYAQSAAMTPSISPTAQECQEIFNDLASTSDDATRTMLMMTLASVKGMIEMESGTKR